MNCSRYATIKKTIDPRNYEDNDILGSHRNTGLLFSHVEVDGVTRRLSVSACWE